MALVNRVPVIRQLAELDRCAQNLLFAIYNNPGCYLRELPWSEGRIYRWTQLMCTIDQYSEKLRENNYKLVKQLIMYNLVTKVAEIVTIPAGITKNLSGHVKRTHRLYVTKLAIDLIESYYDTNKLHAGLIQESHRYSRFI